MGKRGAPIGNKNAAGRHAGFLTRTISGINYTSATRSGSSYSQRMETMGQGVRRAGIMGALYGAGVGYARHGRTGALIGAAAGATGAIAGRTIGGSLSRGLARATGAKVVGNKDGTTTYTWKAKTPGDRKRFRNVYKANRRAGG